MRLEQRRRRARILRAALASADGIAAGWRAAGWRALSSSLTSADGCVVRDLVDVGSLRPPSDLTDVDGAGMDAECSGVGKMKTFKFENVTCADPSTCHNETNDANCCEDSCATFVASPGCRVVACPVMPCTSSATLWVDK